MDFLTELKMAATALYDGMGDHADYCSDLMNQAAELLAKLQDDYDSKNLALKAAKAMQQAETARADANERDAGRYRWLLQQAWFQDACDRYDLEDGGLQNKFEELIGKTIDQAMRHL